MATLNLNDDVRTLVFRRVVRQLTEDPALSNVIGRWLVWDGSPTDAEELPVGDRPVIRLTPQVASGMTWRSPDAQYTDLIINIEVTMPGLDVDDIMNLQGAIEDAFYPKHADSLALELELQKIGGVKGGATTGQPQFSQPLYDPTWGSRQSASFMPIGQIKYQLSRNLNT